MRMSARSSNGAADKLREGGTLACRPDRQLQPLDGRRVAPGRKWMVIRSADGAARSIRAIGLELSGPAKMPSHYRAALAGSAPASGSSKPLRGRVAFVTLMPS